MSQVLFFIVFACANGGRLPLLKELEDSWSGSGDLMSADLANFLLHHHYWSGAELWINKWPAHLTNEWPMNSDLSFQWSSHSKLSLSLGWIPRNLKTFIFKRKSPFLLKITKMITRVISRIFTNSLHKLFSRFLENDHNFRKLLF